MAADPYKYFRIEARDLLDELGRGVLELEAGPAPAELVAKLLRLAHTFKGAARVVKQAPLAELAHAIEDHLTPLRDDPEHATRTRIDAVLALLDRMSAGVDGLVTPVADAAPTATAPPATAAPAGPPTPSVDEPLRAVRIDVGEMDTLLDGIAEANVLLANLRGLADDAERIGHVSEVLAAQLAAPRARRSAQDGDGWLRAAALGDELRTTSTSLQRRLRGGVERLARELASLHDIAERLRLVPVSAVFAPLERIARDSAREVGRRVRVETSGGNVRLDAHVLATIQPALVQLVRNAIAHGVESEAERAAAGKPVVATLRLDVARRGGRIAFVFADDGRGIDMAAVRRAAEARGRTTTPTRNEHDDLVAMLLRGGLTTATVADGLSGRGVGLDIVRTATEQLGGSVAVDTESGRGTRFELVVPVSMSAIEALLVETAGVTAAIPLDAVRHSLRYSASALGHDAGRPTLVHGQDVLPFVSLRQPLGLAASDGAGPGALLSAVVVAGSSNRVAIGVERVLGVGTVVMRPVPALAPTDPVVAGLSLDERGDPQLVLDPEGLVASALAGASTPGAAAGRAPAPILVVDDSLTTRMLEQSILESAGYRVEVATSAEEALDKARATDYSLFLVDVEMPGMNGFELLEIFGADPRLRTIPAILVTSLNAPEDLARGRAVGAAAYVVKSEFDQNALLGIIADLVAR